MDVSTEAHLRTFSQGQSSSRQMREQTGPGYSQMLDALGELGLRPPSIDYDTASKEVSGDTIILPPITKPTNRSGKARLAG